jgi:hypothetical protein
MHLWEVMKNGQGRKEREGRTGDGELKKTLSPSLTCGGERESTQR